MATTLTQNSSLCRKKKCNQYCWCWVVSTILLILTKVLVSFFYNWWVILSRMHRICTITSHFTISSVQDLVISNYRKQGFPFFTLYRRPKNGIYLIRFILWSTNFLQYIKVQSQKCLLLCSVCVCFCHTSAHGSVKCSNSYIQINYLC